MAKMELPSDKIDFYKNVKILSYGKIFNMSIGNRSIGKSFDWKSHLVRNFLKKGKQGIYVRRHENEITEAMPFFFDDIGFQFPNLDWKVQGGNVFIDGNLAIMGTHISYMKKLKSRSMQRVTRIFQDEFLPDDNRYIGGAKNYYFEPKAAISFYNSIARAPGKPIREDVKYIMCANAISVINPYFLYFGIDKRWRLDAKYIKGKQWILEITRNEQIAEMIRNSSFGELIEGTEYESYALDNKFMLDNRAFIEEMSINNSYYLITFIYLGKRYAVRWLEHKGLYYISEDVLDRFTFVIALTNDDHEPNRVVLQNNRNIPVIKRLKFGWTVGTVRFQNIGCKMMFLMLNDLV